MFFDLYYDNSRSLTPTAINKETAADRYAAFRILYGAKSINSKCFKKACLFSLQVHFSIFSAFLNWQEKCYRYLKLHFCIRVQHSSLGFRPDNDNYDLCTGVLVRRLRRKYLLNALSAHNTSSGFCITTKNKLHIRNFTCRNKMRFNIKKQLIFTRR